MNFFLARGRTSQLVKRAIIAGSARRSISALSAVANQTSSDLSFGRSLLLQNDRQRMVHVGRRFCHNSSNDPDATIEENVKETALVQQEGFDASPSTINVPDVWPNLPIIAINRYPLFPGFIKRVDIVRDEALKELLRRKVKSRQPYVGVFVKRNDDDKSETVTSIGDLYPVGAFAQILEVHDQTVVVELLLNAHRRIRILEPLDESLEPRAPHISKINGRRTPGGKKAAAAAVENNGTFPLTGPTDGGGRKKRRDAAVPPPPAGADDAPPPAAEEKRLIYARTENIITDPFERTAEIKASMMAIIQAVRDIVSYNQFFGQQINLLLHPSQNVSENPIYLCDLVATLVHSAETADLQQMMEETNLHRRLQLAIELLEKEKTIAKLTHQIGKDVEKKVQDHHRRYLLGEQLKSIKKELGIEKDEKQTIIEKLEERLKDLNVPEHAMNVIKEEQTKLGFLDPHSSEFSVARNYLDWLTNIPWGKTTEESLRLDAAAKILDEDHYGMKDVKDRILEFIAVGILKQKISGKILCFHGPPGVGKTSIAKSIARALNRKYYRFSVGGMTDVAEIKGHRRTYIGAMPGKMIQCLKKVQCENPIVLIDEVDKIGGAGFHGDPASALLELLDPEQNANFMDHFLDVPVDLSKVLFICTANVLDTIPEALADRMEMIEVSGYVAEEKIKIADRYLIPQCREDCNLPTEKLQIDDNAIERIIKHYCRESGVRNLQKHLEKIFRKAAFIITGRADKAAEKSSTTDVAASSQSETNVADEPKSLPTDLSGDAEAQRTGDDLFDIPTDPIVVDTANLRRFLGREKFTSDRMYDTTPPGVIMGLAWTSMGGSALYIETSLCQRLRNGAKPADVVEIDAIVAEATPSASPTTKPEEGAHEQPGSLAVVTGRLGDVMKESMQTAYTVAKNTLLRRAPDNSFLHAAHIHVHVPEGATPKDGPSAGCTIASALISLALDTPALQNLAMTGEVSLTGKVLPVGGIREKVIAAKRADVRTVLLPSENKKDFDDLPEFIRRGVDVHFVDHYDEVFDLVFPDYKPKTDA